jgi:LPS export ABC transporter protein LptC
MSRSWLLLALLCLIIGITVSCEQKAEEAARPLRIKSDAPLMSARNIDVLFSDSGKVTARLVAPLLNRFGGTSPYIELPEGFRIFIYDSLQQIATVITGKKGVRHEYTRLMEAWGNVVVRNEKKKEQILSEHLTWDENRRRIWSDVEVTITRPDQIITGSSMEANDAFTWYTIEDMNGEMMVSRDSL